VRRADGQVIQLPRLLSLLAPGQDGQRIAQLVKILTAERGKVMQAEHVTLLIDQRLRSVVIASLESRTPCYRGCKIGIATTAAILVSAVRPRVSGLWWEIFSK
jgi:hypothetical protein